MNSEPRAWQYILAGLTATLLEYLAAMLDVIDVVWPEEPIVPDPPDQEV